MLLSSMQNHILKRKIYYHDTDCGGVVYYSNYLKYFEEGRTEFMVAKGIDLNNLSFENIFFVVKRAEIDYIYPARYGDTIQVETTFNSVRGVRLDFSYVISSDARELVRGKTLLVCVGEDMKPRRLPEAVIESLL